MDFALKGKVALVVASSKGLGRACALQLAREGARVAISSRDPERLERTANEIEAETGAEVIPVVGDVSNEAHVEAMVSTTVERLGPIDILITNTGAPAGGMFDDLSDQDWIEAFELVTLSVVRLLRLVLPPMRKRGWGRVISIQSTSVKQPIPHLVLSNGIRPGTQGILKSVVQGAAADGITINTVLPGVFLTDRLRNDLSGRAEKAGTTLDQEINQVAKLNPTGRVGEPRELGSVVAFLASEQASYINGATIQVDGGSIRALS
jgi:3-oxoacyl-[acyl-carrier protein] reductase